MSSGGPHRIELANELVSIRLGRDFVATTLRGILDDEDLDASRLLTSELVANAVRHGQGTIALHVEVGTDDVMVRVRDEGDGDPVLRSAPTGEGGRGLRLVDSLSATWGHDRSAGGTSVWFRLPRSTR